MASLKAKHLYDLGIALSDAWSEFAPEKLGLELAAQADPIDAFTNEFDPHHMISIAGSFTKAADVSKERRRIEGEMKEHLLSDLFNGELIATAYREHPSRSQSPVLISAEKFENHDPDWSAETFTVRGIQYGAIRITDPQHPKLHLKPKPPKGSRSAIQEAIALLCKNNRDFCNWPRKFACEEVRKSLNSEYKYGNGLSDQNISKAIVAYCGAKGIII